MLNAKEEEEIIIIEVTGPITELGVDQGMAMEIEEMKGLIIGKVTEETTLGRSMVSKDTEIEVQVRIATCLDKDLGTVQGIGINMVETKVEIEDSSLGLFQDTRSSSHVSTNRDRLRCYRLPNNCKKGGTFKNIRDDRYLTEDQAKFVHYRVNAGEDINTETMK